MSILQTRDLAEEENLTPLSPYAKRRRYHPYAMSPTNLQTPRRTSLQSHMNPPPRPPPSGVGSSNDLVTLPPLHTEHGKSVEAMVMTIPHINKIKVLAKISPPLAAPEPTSSALQGRGAIVAIDGESDDLIKEITRWLTDELNKVEEITVRTFEAPSRSDEVSEEGEKAKDTSRCFLQYVESIVTWHKLSQEIIEFVTSPSRNDPPPPTTEDQQKSPPPTASTSSDPPAKVRKPVALIPGFMLTHANRAAITIPINDAYAPTDHWRWAATMWRGVVGADLTIWIKNSEPDDVAKHGGLEVREDAKALILRKEEGKEFGGKALRRLGFEVAECARASGRSEGQDGRET